MSIEKLLKDNMEAMVAHTEKLVELSEKMEALMGEFNKPQEAPKPKKETKSKKKKDEPKPEPVEVEREVPEENTSLFPAEEEEPVPVEEPAKDEPTKGAAPIVNDAELPPWYKQTRLLANKYSRETGDPSLVQAEAAKIGFSDLRKANNDQLYTLAARLGELMNIDPMKAL